MHILILEYHVLKQRLECSTLWQVDIRITPGTHISEIAVNKQLNDKERVAAALGAWTLPLPNIRDSTK